VPTYTVSPIEGLRNALGKQAVVKLILVDDANQSATIDGKAASFTDAIAEAASADAVVMMAGTISEEGADRATFTDASGKVLAASAAQGSGLDWYTHRSNKITTPSGSNEAKDSRTTAMIAALLATRSRTGRAMSAKSVLVLKDNAGVALPAALVGPRGPAILEVWFPGQEDGNIVADLLFGKANPSGRLPVTFPFAGKSFLDHATASQFPGVAAADGKGQTVTYSEQLAIGYRWYDANAGGGCAEKAGKNLCVAFPFGHGLSYSSFTTAKPSVSFDGKSGSWRVTTRVTNSGKFAGAEVVQVYLSLPPSANAKGLRQPPKRLVGFGKIELAPGASGEVSVTIDPAASNHPLSVWNEAERKWVVPSGSFKVLVGRSSAPRDLTLAGTINR
jgi:beta-glucosidase